MSFTHITKKKFRPGIDRDKEFLYHLRNDNPELQKQAEDIIALLPEPEPQASADFKFFSGIAGNIIIAKLAGDRELLDFLRRANGNHSEDNELNMSHTERHYMRNIEKTADVAMMKYFGPDYSPDR